MSATEEDHIAENTIEAILHAIEREGCGCDCDDKTCDLAEGHSKECPVENRCLGCQIEPHVHNLEHLVELITDEENRTSEGLRRLARRVAAHEDRALLTNREADKLSSSIVQKLLPYTAGGDPVKQEVYDIAAAFRRKRGLNVR